MTGLGRILQEARAVRGIALEEAENATRISRRYLEALENEDFSVFPAPVYARGFLRSYSQYLGLNPVDVLALYPAPTANEPGTRGRTAATPQQPGRERRPTTTTTPRTHQNPAAPPTQTRIPQPSRAPAIMTAGVIVFLIVLGVVYIASSLGGGDTTPPGATATATRVVRTTTGTAETSETPGTVQTPGGTVPDLVTRDVSDATDDLDSRRIPYVVITVDNDVQQAGEVFDQSPPAGTEVNADVAVTLLVNATAQPTEEPTAEP